MEQLNRDTRSHLEATTYTVIYSLMTVLSLAGNSLVCLSFYRNRRLRTISNFYVLSLAIADIIASTFFFPFSTVATGLRRWPFGYIFCQFNGFLVPYWSQVSTCSLAMASVNRYFCVLKPSKYRLFFTRKKAALSIVVMWVLLLVQALAFFALPVIYRWYPVSSYCRGTFLDKITENIYYVFYGCFYVIAMSLVVFCYSKVYRAIRQHNNAVIPSLQDANRVGSRSAQEIKASRVLFAAVVGFFVCWTPAIVTFLFEFGFLITVPPIVHSLYPTLCSFSSLINPVIYGVMNRAMRKEFENILFCRKDG
ncbi:muscarinic acetylcholine receptor gar-3-like [Orbicella faveolata]|uniref:muscarinic acetylcholine receptor gar-3-like n=1 Tax=Orbicella faveolata TaxID=48498 RepID=UPI0009E2F391|nr:muscarinic acetylcholine receptor gar-3-like [Orbicella faveolata]